MTVRDQWGNLARMPGLHLFFEGHPGIFNDHRESGPRFNVSSEGRVFSSIKMYLSFSDGFPKIH